jgi:Icc-related predicted phosphoesterase
MQEQTSKQIEGIVAYISDIHGDKTATKKIVQRLQQENIQTIILGGDIPDFSAQSLTFHIKQFLTLKKPIILFPGSHENSELYTKTLKELKHKLVIDGVTQRKIAFGAFDFLIVPGSDSVSTGTKPYNGGNYKLIKKKSPQTVQKLTRYLKEQKVARKVSAIAISDTIKVYNKKRPSIIFAHIPLACKTKKGIDLATFGTFEESFSLSPAHKRKKIFKTEFSASYNPDMLVNGVQAKILQEHNYPVQLQQKNVGSSTLKKFASKKNICAYVCGHIHEAGPRAINPEEKTIRQNNWTQKVFINNGPGSQGHITLLTLRKDGSVKYQFVQV